MAKISLGFQLKRRIDIHQFFSLFLEKMKSSCRSIARGTRYEVTEQDLQSEAWIVAEEISEKRGHQVDFSGPFDQDMVIRWVSRKTVRRGDWHMRQSVRIDEERESEDVAVKWSETAQPVRHLGSMQWVWSFCIGT